MVPSTSISTTSDEFTFRFNRRRSQAWGLLFHITDWLNRPSLSHRCPITPSSVLRGIKGIPTLEITILGAAVRNLHAVLGTTTLHRGPLGTAKGRHHD